MFECQQVRWFDFRHVLQIVHGEFTSYIYIDSIFSIRKNTRKRIYSIFLKNGEEYRITFNNPEDEVSFIEGM